MPDDDLERFRKFMIEQQAQFWADLRASEERHQRHEREMKEFDRRLKEFREETENRFRALVDVTMSLARHVEELTHHGEETDRRFRETDYKLNALIDTVDKLVRRNGSAS
jgi:chromosome segregation ATPase